MAATGVTASTARHDFLGDEDKDTSGPASLAFYTLGALDFGGPKLLISVDYVLTRHATSVHKLNRLYNQLD